MRKIFCEPCGSRRPVEGLRWLPDGTREVYAASSAGPAEHERVTWGVARTPRPEQRYIELTAHKDGGVDETTVFPLSLDGYNCDNCNATIRPGDRCVAWTVWTEGREIGRWEDEYLSKGSAS